MSRIHDQVLSRLEAVDLNLLHVFDIVYRERSLRRAAERMALTPSAVSHALGRLRGILEDALFVRDGQSMAPTRFAERIAPRVREGLLLLGEALRGKGQFDPTVDVRQVTLATHEELEPGVLPPLAARLAQSAPSARLASVRLDRARLTRELASGRIDLAVDVARPTDPEVLHAVLARDEFCVVSARPRRLDAAAYLAARHVTVSSRPSGPGVEDLLLGPRGYRRDVAVRCQHYEAAFRLVAQSDLLLTVPRGRAELLQRALRVHLLPLPLRLRGIELHVYWHQQVDEDPRSRWLRRELLESARAGPARLPGVSIRVRRA